MPLMASCLNLCWSSITVLIALSRHLSIDEIKNYRPVSNLSFVSKLLERVVSAQLNDYLESHVLLPARQSAYRVGHSCETALLRIHSELITAADAGNISLIAMLDLSAAFDCRPRHPAESPVLQLRLGPDHHELAEVVSHGTHSASELLNRRIVNSRCFL